MKVQYVTDDSKTFDSKEEAEKYEASLNSTENKKKELIEKINNIDKEIKKKKDELLELLDTEDELLAKYKDAFMSDEQKKLIDQLEDIFSDIIG